MGKVGAKISIIVPVYKAENVIQKCINSILAQSYRNFEVILVDDGSPDGSGKIIDSAHVRSSKVIAVHKENGGPSSAAIKGVEYASGDYIMFIDGDDWIEPDMLEEMALHITGCNAEVICSNYIIDKEKKDRHGNITVSSVPVKMPAPSGEYTGDRLKSELLNELIGHEKRPIFLSRCFKLYSADIVKNNLKYVDASIRMGDDVNMITPILLDAKRIFVMKDAFFYHYVFYSTSIVHSYDPGLYDNCVRLRSKLSEILELKHVPNANEKARYEFLYLFFLVIKSELRRPLKEAFESNKRIRELCKIENTSDLLTDNPDKICDVANKLMVPILRRPSNINMTFARAVFGIQKILKA
ncbi:glycosyltransferase family 2 protein [Butyrivibrio sp. TB]|uniref:glycosyltransferase family 2 protein n=1 Tax=Butyrivibrio sp. TB TaxID=1520809 RepID=UPI0008C2C3D1|nr:glycosyltransferase family 2 protein [Butyrivibrio sp. TB]SEQ37165.1 Glycosyltransferase involved in cell wall bisynthesis [Butyrivibrio sp. TB]